MAQVFAKNELLEFSYKIKFFMAEDNVSQRYRVQGDDGNTYCLIIYNSSKLLKGSFSNGGLLEVGILSLFNTESIVKLIDSGEVVKDTQKYHYLITSFVSGETLHDKLSRVGAFSQYAAVPIVIAVLEALSVLHQHPKVIIHNNVNVKSITLDYSGDVEKPVLGGFNFAREITSKINSVDVQGLSPFYIAPELYNGVFTPQSDVFSAGALLYHLIMGIPPWHVEIPKYQHTEEKFVQAISDTREKSINFDLNVTDGTIDDHLKNTIRKALALNVDERFSSVQEFIKFLKREAIFEEGHVKTANSSTIKAEEITGKDNEKAGNKGFAAIAGMQDLKDILYNDIIRALNEKELYESYGVTIPNGMLLYGPPGCGKTFIAEKFSEEVGFNFLLLKPSDFKSKWVNDTELKIAGVFKQAVENAPSIIFIDEFDAVVPNREGNLHEMNASAVNELLIHMSNCSERGVFVIAASNRPEKIDPAILRTGRIDRIIYLPPPDYEARVSMFEMYLKSRPIDFDINFFRLAELTDHYVSSDIKFIVDEASRAALKSRVRITQKMIETVISDTRPSISYSEIKKYELLKEKLESK